MRRLGLVCVFFFLLSSLCLSEVIATIYPLFLLVRDITGNKVKVSFLLDPYTSPHEYELSPKALARLKKADAVVAVGCGMENWLSPILREKRVFFLCEKRDNPHVWLSPSFMAQRLKSLTEFLSRIYPEFSETFRKNKNILGKKLKSLVSSGPRDVYVIGHHAAWVYLAEDLGYKYLGSIEPSPHQEPTPLELFRLIKRACGKKVIVINEKGHNPRLARLVAEKTNGCLVTLNPLGELEDKSFIGFLERIVKALKRCWENG